MTARLAGSLALAVVVTFALFYGMNALIAVNEDREQDEIHGSVIDFVRLKEESDARTKERRLPQKLNQAKPPPPPDVRVARASKPKLGEVDGTVVALPTGDLAAGPRAGAAISDMDVVPLVRIPPEYPRRAAQLGLSGWVLLEFNVTSAGTVEDVQVVDSDPPRTFDRAARRAVEKFKYRPKIENGKPVPRQGVQIVITFDPKEAG